MRKTCGLLFLALFVLVPGCTCESKRSGPAVKPAPSTSASTSTSTEKKRLPTVKEGAYNVAFVYVGPIGDGGWTYAHDQGRKELEATIKDVHTVYIESVGEGAEAEQVIRGWPARVSTWWWAPPSATWTPWRQWLASSRR